MQTSIKASYKLILCFLMGLANHSQISQNSTLAISLQYLKKKIRDEVEFWHADKHQSFLQVDFKTLGIRASYKIILSLLTGMIRSSHQRCSVKNGVLRIFAKFTGKHLCQSLFFKNVTGAACNLIEKETLAQVFSCEFCESSKNTFFTEHVWATASA